MCTPYALYNYTIFSSLLLSCFPTLPRSYSSLSLSFSLSLSLSPSLSLSLPLSLSLSLSHSLTISLSHSLTLGIAFDSQLTFCQQIRQSYLRTTQRLGFLKKISAVLDSACRLTVYNGFVRPV